MKNDSSLRLVTVGNDSRVLDGDAELMRIRVGDLFFAGMTLVGPIRFRADGPLRINNLMNSWHCFVPKRLPDQTRVREEKLPTGLRVHVEPETRGGVADVECWFDFARDPRTDGWMIDHHCRLVLRRKVTATELGLTLNPGPDPHAPCTYFWEIDDPNYANNYGPAVPMRQDWLGIYEPTCGPDTFRKHWRRQAEMFVYREPSGRVRTIRFHRGLLHCLSRAGTFAYPIKGLAGVVHTDGTGTLYEFRDGKPIVGHICEWGFDTHFWRSLPLSLKKPVLPKGLVLETTYRMREVPRDDMRKLLRGAKPVEPTRAQRQLYDNVPIYEEPVNHFATAWTDTKVPDAYAWMPGVGATWDRRVGRRRPGSLRVQAPYYQFNQPGSWLSPRAGTTLFMNPLVPHACYRLRGYVRVVPDTFWGTPGNPSISIKFHKYAGPGTFSPEILPAELFTGRVVGPLVPNRWLKIEVISGPVKGNVMGATLGCHFQGNGAAWFDEIAFEKVDQ